MKTPIRLIAFAVAFAFLTPATSTLHAQVLAPTRGIDVPDGTRKCIKPKGRAPVLTNLFAPLACLEPVVNVSAMSGNQSESFVVVNPTNTNNVVAFSNLTQTAFSARTRRMVARLGRVAPWRRMWRAVTDRRPGTRSAICS